MADIVKYNNKQYEYFGGAWYKNGRRLTTSALISRLNALKDGKSISDVSPDFKSKFKKGTFKLKLDNWQKPMTARGGKIVDGKLVGGEHNWGQRKFYDLSKHKPYSLGESKLWGIDKNKYKKGIVAPGTQIPFEELPLHFLNVIHQLMVSSEYFRIALGNYALKVFDESFEKQKFNSSHSIRWASLAPYTIKKRRKRGTWGGPNYKILREYGDLRKSLKLEKRSAPMTTKIYTAVVPANQSHYKKYAVCYAGLHNEGHGTYGRARKKYKPRHYIKRQFMGHSSHLNPYSSRFVKQLITMYLFDNVFLSKKV